MSQCPTGSGAPAVDAAGPDRAIDAAWRPAAARTRSAARERRRAQRVVYELRKANSNRPGCFRQGARRGPNEVTAFIDEHRGRFGIESICRVLDVSASAYYRRATGRRSQRLIDDERLLDCIREVMPRTTTPSDIPPAEFETLNAGQYVLSLSLQTKSRNQLNRSRLRRPTHQRRQDQARDHPLPEALHRPRGLPRTPSRPRRPRHATDTATTPRHRDHLRRRLHRPTPPTPRSLTSIGTQPASYPMSMRRTTLQVGRVGWLWCSSGSG
jgi:hypothetical protein